MDAIKSVDNEVDKVLTSFESCLESSNNKIDEILNIVNTSKWKINNETKGKHSNTSISVSLNNDQ